MQSMFHFMLRGKKKQKRSKCEVLKKLVIVGLSIVLFRPCINSIIYPIKNFTMIENEQDVYMVIHLDFKTSQAAQRRSVSSCRLFMRVVRLKCTLICWQSKWYFMYQQIRHNKNILRIWVEESWLYSAITSSKHFHQGTVTFTQQITETQ
jgi:hypothetical protein